MSNIDDLIAVIKRKMTQYEARDVYNMNEMDLFYNLASDIIISHR